MHLRDIINEQPTDFSIIQADCAQYLCESQQHMTYRMLPRTYSDVQRVKVRQQKRTDFVTQVFNEAFSDVHNLRQRSVIAQSYQPTPTETHEPFYVFPLNGYKYVYSKEVKDSSSEYKHMIDVMIEQLNNDDVATEIISDVVKYTYTNAMLSEGMRAGAEIIFYNIPSYYAVRCGAYPNPQQLITYLY